jgi:hypothetical protein
LSRKNPRNQSEWKPAIIERLKHIKDLILNLSSEVSTMVTDVPTETDHLNFMNMKKDIIIGIVLRILIGTEVECVKCFRISGNNLGNQLPQIHGNTQVKIQKILTSSFRRKIEQQTIDNLVISILKEKGMIDLNL